MKEETRPLDLDEAYLEIDRVIDRCTKTHGWSPIIPQYAAKRSWAWYQWRGTIIERLWSSVLWNMLVPSLLIAAVRLVDPTTTLFQLPAESHFIISTLMAVTHGWNYLLTLTTFVLVS